MYKDAIIVISDKGNKIYRLYKKAEGDKKLEESIFKFIKQNKVSNALAKQLMAHITQKFKDISKIAENIEADLTYEIYISRDNVIVIKFNRHDMILKIAVKY